MDQWEAIRDLDDKENWTERTAVLSKDDHLDLLQCATEILNDILDTLPDSVEVEQKWSQSSQGGNGVGEQFTDADFQYSAAQFDVDYLERISSDSTEPSELTRQSLYVKFDPLVGRDSPKAGKTLIDPSGSSDLLMLSTPPASGLKSCLTSKTTKSTEKQVHIGQIEIVNPSPLISTNTSMMTTPSSLKPRDAVQRTLLDSSPKLQQNDGEPLEESFTDHYQSPAATDEVAFPVTDTLVKILKYSEEDLLKKKGDIVREAREKARTEKAAEVDALRKEIAAAQREAKKIQQKDNSIKTAISSHKPNVTKLEEEIQQFRERNEVNQKKETDTLDHHNSCLKDAGLVEECSSVIHEDMNTLEGMFEECHKCYLALKKSHKQLTQQSEQLEKKRSELEVCNKTCSAQIREMKLVLGNTQTEEITFEQTRKEFGAKITLEKAQQDMLQMKIESLKQSIQQTEQEKQQLSQMCEELMKQM